LHSFFLLPVPEWVAPCLFQNFSVQFRVIIFDNRWFSSKAENEKIKAGDRWGEESDSRLFKLHLVVSAFGAGNWFRLMSIFGSQRT
jgi:hypothetical protein